MNDSVVPVELLELLDSKVRLMFVQISKNESELSGRVLRIFLDHCLGQRTELILKPDNKTFDLVNFYNEVCKPKKTTPWAEVIFLSAVNLTLLALHDLNIDNGVLTVIGNNCKLLQALSLKRCTTTYTCDWEAFGESLDKLTKITWWYVNAKETALLTLLTFGSSIAELNLAGIIVEHFWFHQFPNRIKRLCMRDVHLKLPNKLSMKSVIQYIYLDCTHIEWLSLNLPQLEPFIAETTLKVLRKLEHLHIAVAASDSVKPSLLFNVLTTLPKLKSLSFFVPNSSLDTVLARMVSTAQSIGGRFDNISRLRVSQLDAFSLNLLRTAFPRISRLTIIELKRSFTLLPLIALLLYPMDFVEIHQLELDLTTLALSVHGLLFKSAVFIYDGSKETKNMAFNVRCFTVILSRYCIMDQKLFTQHVKKTSSVLLWNCKLTNDQLLDIEIQVKAFTFDTQDFIETIKGETAAVIST